MAAKKLQKRSQFEIENKYNRTFSEEFKRNKVKDLVEKRVSTKQLCDLYQISRTSVYKWLYKYSPHHSAGVKMVVQMESEAHKTQELLQRVAELERIVGQKQLELDYTSKLIEIASAELGYDIKKNIGQKQLSGSAAILLDNTTK
jgi:transposase-like protein